ncbi:MAG TPA: NEW3 domain-containing protein, partial [Afifellaceae bacterium]|nr:NEW3 domain-containing protein [Afifellaceae bacterium]
GTMQFDTSVSQKDHPDIEKNRYGIYRPNIDDSNTTTININQPIYRHVECSPREEPLEVSLEATELDTFANDTIAEVATSMRGDDSGKVLRQVGGATFTFSVLTKPVPALNAKCAVGAPTGPSPKVAMVLEPAHPFGNPGSTALVAVAFTNVAASPMGYRLALEPFADSLSAPDPAGWSSLSLSELSLEPGESTELALNIEVPSETEPGDYPLQLVAYADDPAENQVEFVILSVEEEALPVVTAPAQTEDEARAEDRRQAILAGIVLVAVVALAGLWAARRRRRTEA